MDFCLQFAPLIAVLTSLLKMVPAFARRPKTVALMLTVAVALLRTAELPATREGIVLMLECVAAAFGVSVATFEAALKPLGKKLGVDIRTITGEHPTRRKTDKKHEPPR